VPLDGSTAALGRLEVCFEKIVALELRVTRSLRPNRKALSRQRPSLSQNHDDPTMFARIGVIRALKPRLCRPSLIV